VEVPRLRLVRRIEGLQNVVVVMTAIKAVIAAAPVNRIVSSAP
jgi:hypothetical protein